MKNCTVNHYDMEVDWNESTLFVVIDLADEIIGSCMLFHDGLMQDFHIVGKLRGVGLGSGLLEKVEEIAKEKRISLIHGIVQAGNKAIQFWNKKDFSTYLCSDGIRVSKLIIKWQQNTILEWFKNNGSKTEKILNDWSESNENTKNGGFHPRGKDQKKALYSILQSICWFDPSLEGQFIHQKRC